MAYAYVRNRGRVGRGSIYAILVASWGTLGVGQVSAWLETVGNALAGWLSTFGSTWLGIGGPALLMLIPAFVAFDLMNSGIWKPTPWFALITPTLLVIVGSAYAGRSDVLGLIGDLLTWIVTLPSAFG